MMSAGVWDQFAGAWATSRFCILLEGAVCRAWFLSERFVRQTMGLLDPIVLMAPPESMRSADSLSVDAVTQFMVGLDADYFRAEGDYATFIQIHLMPPLTGARGGEGVRAPTRRETPRTTRVTRARARGAPRTEQRTRWPELPTMLTCWLHTGAAYQVPIEPATAEHELVEVRGPTKASIEYTGSALELIASLMGMVQRRETLLGLHGIPIPAIPITPAAAECQHQQHLIQQ